MALASISALQDIIPLDFASDVIQFVLNQIFANITILLNNSSDLYTPFENFLYLKSRQAMPRSGGEIVFLKKSSVFSP